MDKFVSMRAFRNPAKSELRRAPLILAGTSWDYRRPSYRRLILAGSRQEARTWAEKYFSNRSGAREGHGARRARGRRGDP